MEKQKKANFDFLSGGISVIVGLIYGLLSYNLKRSPMGDPLAPSVFPLMLSGGMVIFGALLMIKSDMASTKRAFAKIKEKTTANDILSRKMIVLTVVAATVYALIFEHLGYVLSTFLFVGFIMSVLERKKIVKNLIISAIFSVVVYYVFFYLLGISLPMTPILNI
jgi:putative tricarboxylic transport membrane protein